MNRQESLFAILPRAVKAAKENGGNQLMVLYAPAYVDEYAEGSHVFCPVEAIDLLYPARAAWARECDAIVEKDGSVFATKVGDALEMLKRNTAKFSKVVLVEEKPVCPNCGQWQHPKGDILDCLNDCAGRGLAPKVVPTIWNSDGTDGPVLICAPEKEGK